MEYFDRFYWNKEVRRILFHKLRARIGVKETDKFFGGKTGKIQTCLNYGISIKDLPRIAAEMPEIWNDIKDVSVNERHLFEAWQDAAKETIQKKSDFILALREKPPVA